MNIDIEIVLVSTRLKDHEVVRRLSGCLRDRCPLRQPCEQVGNLALKGEISCCGVWVEDAIPLATYLEKGHPVFPQTCC